MKILSIVLLTALVVGSTGAAIAQEKELQGTISLSGAWAIYPTAVAWAQGFQKLHPKVKIDVSAGGAGKGAADAIAGLVDIGMVSREPDPSEVTRGVTPIYILHDAVFPVVSDKNPALGAILKKGLAKDKWTWIYISGIAGSWDDVTGEKIGKPIHVYTRSDSCGAAASWAAYFNKKQDDLKGVGVYGDPGLLEAAKRDNLGIGYTNFSYIFTRDGKVVDGARVVPIDANNNGLADKDEIYENRQDAVKAIESGKYPVTRKNYFFVKGKPQGIVKEFVEFALSDEGSKIVDQVGASLPLPRADREKVLEGLK